ncbi:hypothetical protein Taro_043625 [Colocasia esculenta]|uniref:Uncharacterized protein n=1 Tax=Colocasia esculenta TaxID=4460 RepID=A0A843WRW8_COLES|nr:hypothetical protein [Colocasia esculenta]
MWHPSTLRWNLSVVCRPALVVVSTHCPISENNCSGKKVPCRPALRVCRAAVPNLQTGCSGNWVQCRPALRVCRPGSAAMGCEDDEDPADQPGRRSILVEQEAHQKMWMLENWVVERNEETEVREGHEKECHHQLGLEADPHSKEADPPDLGAGPLQLEAGPLELGAGPLDFEAVPPEMLDLGIDCDFSFSKGTPKCWNTEVKKAYQDGIGFMKIKFKGMIVCPFIWYFENKGSLISGHINGYSLNLGFIPFICAFETQKTQNKRKMIPQGFQKMNPESLVKGLEDYYLCLKRKVYLSLLPFEVLKRILVARQDHFFF